MGKVCIGESGRVKQNLEISNMYVGIMFYVYVGFWLGIFKIPTHTYI